MTVWPSLSVARGYGVALMLVAMALAIGFLLGPDTEIQLAPLLFIAAGVMAAWYAGPGPGLAAVLLSALLVEYFWVEPRFSLAIDTGQLPWFLTFLLILALAMALAAQRRRSETALAASRDALELRVAQRTEQLHASEQRWRRLFETSTVGIALVEPQGRVLQANQALQDMLGYNEMSLRQMTLAELIGEPAATDEDGAELPLRRQDGGTVWASLSLSLIPAGEHTPAMMSAVVIDITARRRAQEDWRRAQFELERASRLTAMGVFAAAIAHEVNQPLSAVVTNGQAAQRWLRAEPPNLAEATTALERIVRDSNRAADIIRSIRQLLTPAEERRQALSLHDCIRRLLPLLENELTALKINLGLDLAALDDRVPGDVVQLQQLILNLLLNSVDSLRGVTGRQRSLTIRTSLASGQLLVAVEDNGQGLAGDVELASLFEPFVSTKPSGMGVGLTICRHVVESHGGRIWAERRKPHGARFFFTLPLANSGGSVASREDLQT